MSSLYQKSVREHLIMYNKVSGVSCFSIDENGNAVDFEGVPSQYCEKFRELSGDACSCNAAHLYVAKQAEKLGEPYVYFCPGGLVHWTVPIVIKGIFRGALLAGPVQMVRFDDYMIDGVIEANHFNISSRGALRTYARLVPIIEPERIKYLADMLYVVVKDIIEEESAVISERKKLYLEQASIHGNIQDAKEQYQQDYISKYYSFEMENEFIAKIKHRDKSGSRIILNELLGHILFNNVNNLEVTKARAIELMIVFSRAAIEGGGNLEMIFGLKLKYLNEVYELNTVEDVGEWIVKVLECFEDCVYSVDTKPNSDLVNRTINYISENYTNDISLESISESVHSSATYLSKIFKRETNVNLIDYLNNARIEESKKMLKDLKLSLAEISARVGIADKNYFCKVFKKFTGMSPGKYRNLSR
ncbi:HTH-type transcriptional regulator YesS [Oxobacter pfennigii]|uniref:HTH-type transcriptional regulator YesS n=2 Tax=Oxobacter pfennigii TaxID=36849 RepID=A0A0P8X0U9_9CLOT|nr:PocR ligand-binding domain-containing protein [Oxobacter pfennigii]KPU44411.1 HTH-type transcriptional regulator YesS [Oxobacter pfennigii]